MVGLGIEKKTNQISSTWTCWVGGKAELERVNQGWCSRESSFLQETGAKDQYLSRIDETTNFASEQSTGCAIVSDSTSLIFFQPIKFKVESRSHERTY